MADPARLAPTGPTLTAPPAPTAADPGFAKSASRDNINVKETPTANPNPDSDPDPEPLTVPANVPAAPDHCWDANICEICWLPVTGKRRKVKRSRKKARKAALASASASEPAPAEDLFSQDAEYFIALPCGHRFGSSCLLVWRRTEIEAAGPQQPYSGPVQGACPTCRRPYLTHTCHRKSRSKIRRALSAVKHTVTRQQLPSPCTRCELDALEAETRDPEPFWETGIRKHIVRLAFNYFVGRRQLYGHKPISRFSLLFLNCVPQSWIDVIKHKYGASFHVNPAGVPVPTYTSYPTDSNISWWRGYRDRRFDRRAARNVVAQQRRHAKAQRRSRRTKRKLQKRNVNARQPAPAQTPSLRHARASASRSIEPPRPHTPVPANFGNATADTLASGSEGQTA